VTLLRIWTPGAGLLVALALLVVAPPARSADLDPDADALALEAAPVGKTEPAGGLKLSLEAALGQGKLRSGGDTQTLRRASVDLVYATRLDKQWRFTLSDRLDSLHPNDGEATVNSLRELYVGWQDSAAQWLVEFGRVNLRQGPGLGFNPTDFFRDGALRVSTTVNPLLVREYRLGSVMLRGQRLWSDGSLAVSYSPKLSDHASTDGWSADLGASNARNRGLVSLGTQWSSSTSTQLHVYAEQGGRPQVGASISSLVGGATVAFAEWSWSRERPLLDRAVGAATPAVSGHRIAAGLTYTTASKLSITGEIEHSDFALDSDQRDALAAAQPVLLGAYLFEAQRRQDLAARNAFLIYAKQTDAFWRNFDVTTLLRVNADDHSTLAWLELRYHWNSLDLGLQALQYRGRAGSEFGSSPYTRTLQVLATYYF
jgi:hypothetical protein